MADWLPTDKAAKALQVAPRTLKRWRAKMPDELWKDVAGARMYHVDAIRSWRSTQRNRGRPTAIDSLLSPSPPAGSPTTTPRAPTPHPTSSAGSPAALNEEERKALEELLEADDIRDLFRLADSIPAERVKALAALAKLRKDLADAEKKERENQLAAKELIPFADVQRVEAKRAELIKGRFPFL